MPELSTSSITDITGTSAVGGGNVTSDGNAEITSKGVCWSLEPNPTNNDSKTDEGTGAGQFISNINGLNAGTTYHVRSYATNPIGTAYGTDISFTTLGEAPECITQTPINITSSGATLNGTVNANDLVTNVTFEYGISTAYGQTITSSQSPASGNGLTNISVEISGLTPGTIYHYRVVAVNSIGTANGNDLTFTTAVVLPTLTTTPVSNRKSTSGTSGGTITSDGGASISARGVCWAISSNPTVINDHTIDGEGSGSFTSEIKCLDRETTYYVRAYATNSEGTGYGEQEIFTTQSGLITFNPGLTYGTVMDIDGNCYKTIQIGDQIWMAENLRTSRYNDGIQMPNVTDDIEWGDLSYTVYDEYEGMVLKGTGAYCWYNNDSATFDNEYGKLYNWLAVNSGKLCPVGWRIPILAELNQLLGPKDYDMFKYGAGANIMETGTDHWDESVNPFPEGIVVTNSTGFTALPGGLRLTQGEFNDLGLRGQFWASDKYWFPDLPYRFTIPYYSAFSPSAISSQVDYGLSVRCKKE